MDPVVAFLGRFQDHWLEQVILPALAVGFATAAMLLARSFSVYFGDVTAVPAWVVWFGLPVAVGGVYSGNLLVRARAPILTHVVEGSMVLAIPYVLLRLGGAAPGTAFLSNASLRHPDIYLPLGVLLFGWYLAMSAGRRFARIGSVTRSVEEQAKEERTWISQAITSPTALIEQRRSVVWFFSRRTLGYTLLAALFASAAFDVDHVWDRAWMTWRWSVAASMAALIFFGLVQQGCVFIYQLRATWSEGTVIVTPNFIEHWVKNTFIIAALVLTVALLLPSGFAVLDFVTTAESLAVWLAWFLSQGVDIFNQYALQGPGEELRSSPGAEPPSGGAGFIEGASALLTLTFAALAIAATALVVAGIIVIFLRGEWRRLGGILRLPGIVLYWVHGILNHFRLFLAVAIAWLVKLLNRVPVGRSGGERRRRNRRRNQGKGGDDESETLPAAYIRRLFVRLIREAGAYGMRLRPDQTPHEFAAWMKRELEGADQEIELLADRYVEARYGRRSVERSSLLEAAWSHVVNRLRRRPRERQGSVSDL